MRQWNETRSKEAALTSVSSQHKVDIGAKPNVKFSMAHEVSHHHFLNHSNFCFLLLMCVCVKEGGGEERGGVIGICKITNSIHNQCLLQALSYAWLSSRPVCTAARRPHPENYSCQIRRPLLLPLPA